METFEENITNVSYALLIGGISLILFTINNFNQNGLLGATFGYMSIIFAITLLMMMTFEKTSRNLTVETPITTIMLKLFEVFSPYMLFLSVLFISVTIITFYFDKLTTIDLPQSYKSFTIMSVIFIIIQSGLFLYTSVNPNKKVSNILETSKLRLLGVINLIIVFTSFICLKYNTTDGFNNF